MQGKPVRVTKCQIGDTSYIIESTSSADARKMVCEKAKRLILGSSDMPELKMAS